MASLAQKYRGFTLIELMVVMAIISISMMLVGPNIMKRYDRAKSQVELVQLRETIKKIGHFAFLNGRDISLYFDKGMMKYHYNDNVIVELKKTKRGASQIKRFSYLNFPKQQIQVSASGQSDTAILNVVVGDQEKQLSLDGLLAL